LSANKDQKNISILRFGEIASVGIFRFSNYKSFKIWKSVLQKHLLRYAEQVARQSGNPLQAAGTLRAISDIEQTTTQKAGLSGLTVQ